MIMNKLIVIRAGETVWQQGLPTADESRIQGTVSLPLTSAGRESLRTLAANIDQLRPDCLYSSGNESSGPTADYLAQLCELKTKKLPDLHELDCGLWQGLRIIEIKKRFGRAYRQWRCDPTSVRPPQGESLEEAALRVRKSLLCLNKKNQDKTIVVVADVMTAGLIECLLTGTPLEQLWQIVEKQENIRIFTITQPLDFSGADATSVTSRQDYTA